MLVTTARRRSNHDPRACRLLRRPRIRHALLFEAARKFRRLVTSLQLSAFPELSRLIEHEDRATRSDLLEGLALVVEAECSRADVKSLRVGWRRRVRSNGRVFDFVGLPRVTVGNWTGLAESTVSRAFTILRRAGLIHGPGHDGVNVIPQPVEACPITAATPRGRRGLPAVRRFDELFFVALGMGAWLQHCRTTKTPPKTPPAVAHTIASRNIVRVGRVVDELARALGPPPDSG
jgi:hypothetical protein